MKKIYLDFEARSRTDITQVGAWNYSQDPSTEVLCLCYAVDDAPAKCWIPPKIALQYMFNTRASHKGLMGHFSRVKGKVRSRISKKERVLVCGGRDFSDYEKLREKLDFIHASRGITKIIHGAARGADSLAGRWAKENKVPCEEYPADWDRHGKAAGHIRNQEMLDKGKPTLVVAFDGGRGTANMKERAQAAEVKVLDYSLPQSNSKWFSTWVHEYRQINRGWNWDGHLVLPVWAKYKLKSKPDFVTQIIEKGEDFELEAHNAFFEKVMWRHVCQSRHSFPEVPNEKWSCSAALASVYALPRALGNVGEALNLAVKKSEEGRLAMMQLVKPKPNSSEFDRNIFKYQTLFEYCIDDVRAEREIARRLPPLEGYERDVWLLDQKVNERGVPLDSKMILGGIKIIEEYTKVLEDKMEKLTDGRLNNIRQTAALQLWLEEKGVLVDNVQKATVQKVLERKKLPDAVRSVLEIRQALGQTSTAKYYAMKNHACSDWRARDQFMYSGASTLRWAGRGIQMQNLPRGGVKPTEAMYAAIRSGSWRQVQALGDVMDILSSCIRGAIAATDGKELLDADFSNIEGRVLAWIAGEEWKIKAFEDFDAGIGPDLYLLAYAVSFNVDLKDVDDYKRLIGKVMELALGYMGGVGAFQNMAKAYGLEIEDSVADDLKVKWRAKHPKIVKFWKDVEQAAMKAVITKERVEANEHVSFYVEDGFLFCDLPHGGRLAYYDPKIITDMTPWGEKNVLSFMGVNSVTRKFERQTTYGGKLTENIVQNIARCVMADALLALDKAGFNVIMHVHDQALSEENEGERTMEEYIKVMAQPKQWRAGLPLACEGESMKRFKK